MRHSDHFVFDSLRCETRLVWSAVSRTLLVYGFSLANRRFSLGLLSRLAEQIVVLVPPLPLIFLVLGAIVLGIATPTEAAPWRRSQVVSFLGRNAAGRSRARFLACSPEEDILVPDASIR